MRAVTVCIVAFAVAFYPVLSPEAGTGRDDNGDTMMVSGLGYPPIKAENPAQARLMARRAAILDAYRNALSRAGGPGADENSFYTGLSGFVKGMTIEREEYLEDGGVRIIARVPKGNAALFQGAKDKLGPARPAAGPSSVSLEQWYKIIERSVKFD